MTLNPSPPPRRLRVMRGAGAQLAAHVARVVVQLGMAGILLPIWGLQLYGDYLILIGVAVFVGGSDFGYLTATASDMNVAVARGDREHALDVFRTVARGISVVFALVFVVALAVVSSVPLASVLNLKHMDNFTAAAIVLMVAAQVLLLVFSLLFYGGFTCEGHYGEGILIQAAMMISDFGAVCAVVVLGGGPLPATAASLASRIAGTVVMYIAMRRRAPWLSFGRPAGHARIARRLTGPALAMASIGWGTALNVQAMVIIVGIAAGPTSAAIFATVRTLSRVVLQLTGSISQAVGPELARAYAEGNDALVRRIQRRISQAAVWSSAAIIVLIAVLGGTIIRIWTHGHVHQGGVPLYLLLLSAGLEGAWLTAGSILFFTNRQQRIGLAYALLSVASLPVAYVLTSTMGQDGAAITLVVVASLMLAEVLRHSLPAAHETLAGWVGSLVRPTDVWQALVALRGQLTLIRSS